MKIKKWFYNKKILKRAIKSFLEWVEYEEKLK